MARARATATVLLVLFVGACGSAPVATDVAATSATTEKPQPPEPTPAPTPTPTAAPIDPTALQVGGVAVVIATEPLVLQPAPRIGDPDGILPQPLLPHMRVGLVEGPVEEDGYQWYRVRSGAVEGWAAAASREGEPWLAGVQNGLIAFGLTPVDAPVPQAYTVAADGSGVRQLTSFRSDDPLLDPTTGRQPGLLPVLTCPTGIHGMTWSPGGELLALGLGGCEQVVLTLSPDGAAARLGAGSLPRWSPDGTRVVFGLNVPYAPCGVPCLEGQGPWEIQAVLAAGGPPQPLTRNADPFAAQQPDLSPDGGRLAFSGPDPDGGLDPAGLPATAIYVADGDGGDQRAVADGSLPRWSPNGQQLLILTRDGQVGVIAADGGVPTLLGPGGGAAWSPDGTRVAYTGSDGVARVSTIVGEPATVTFAGRFAGWSPDGQQVLLVVPRDGGGVTLQRAPSAGGAGEALVGIDDGDLTDAAWQPVIVVPTLDGP